MNAEALLFTLSAIGISETVYLIKKRLLSEMPICLIGEDCTKVLHSTWSTIFIVPNDILGLLFYITCSFITVLLVLEVEPRNLLHSIFYVLIAFGSLLSLFFTYLQAHRIKAWCFWCLMSAGTIWLMGFIVSLTLII